MKKIITAITGAAVALSLTACASIVHGTQQKETFVSRPSFAHVRIDGINYGKTPVTINLARKNEHMVRISLPGYKPAKFRLHKKVSGWFFANIALGGVIGMVVDLADGAIYTLKPSHNAYSHVVEGDKNTLVVVLERNSSNVMHGRKIGQLRKAS